jgi:hypothetical protein
MIRKFSAICCEMTTTIDASFTHTLQFACRSSTIRHRDIWYLLTKVSEELLSASLESTNYILKTERTDNTRLHGVTAQKTVICIVTTVRSLYPLWSVTATSGLCFDDSDCRSLQFSWCIIDVNSMQGTCTCKEGFSPSEDGRNCLPGKGHKTHIRSKIVL